MPNQAGTHTFADKEKHAKYLFILERDQILAALSHVLSDED